MNSKTLQATSISILEQKINQVISTEFQPTIGIVFNSIEQDIAGIQSIFKRHNIDLVGCTTAGEIIDDELLEETTAVLLLDMNREHYVIKTLDHDKGSYKAAFQIGTEIKDIYDNIGILMNVGEFGVDAAGVVNGIKAGIGKEVPMYGGLAADGLQMKEIFAYSRDFSTNSGSVILVIDADKIEIKGMAISGWKAIGMEKTITKSEGNIVYEIDNERASDVFIRYFGIANATSDDYLVSLQTNYPLQIIREEDTILRSPLVLDEDNGSITLMGGVNQGDKFRFSNSPGFEVIEQTIEEFEQLKDKSPDVDALILYSCKGRHGALGPLLEDEISGLYNYWNKPMIGFLSYGEIGNTPSGICEFHNETCSLVSLREK